MRLKQFVISLILLGVAASAAAAGEPKDSERLATLYRQSILVRDIDRSMTLYRDILGLTLSRVHDSKEDSYANLFFNVDPGSVSRFAYFDGEDGRKNILGMGEVPNLQPSTTDGPRRAAWVQTVADVESVMEKVRALGLELLPPVEFTSRVTGSQGIETGVIDFDGHLVMFYGLKRPAAD